MRSILLAAVGLLAAGLSPALAQTPADPPNIVAEGQAIVQRAADLAWVQVAVEARAPTSAAARQQAANTMSAVIRALKRSVNDDALRTSGFSVQPEMEYTNNSPRVRGYVARNQVEVRVDDLEKLPAIIDMSTAGGATTVAGLRFDLKNRAEAEREALRLAVEDAMGRAEAIARGARRSVGAIIRIIEQRSFASPIRNMAFDGMMAQKVAEPTPIVPGDIEIRAQVSLSVGIR
jgi:uncharacterized protein YggE